MRSIVASLAGFAAVLAASSFSTPAQAIAYQFVPEPWNTKPPGLPIVISLAFADGFTAVKGDEYGSSLAGILAFSFAADSFKADLADLQALQAACNPPGPDCGTVDLDYDLAPDAGYMLFNNSASNFFFEYAGGRLITGEFSTDFIGPEACRISSTCQFAGAWQRIPEPESLALLASGLALARLARRRQPA